MDLIETTSGESIIYKYMLINMIPNEYKYPDET